jgi:hypothetical protein
MFAHAPVNKKSRNVQNKPSLSPSARIIDTDNLGTQGLHKQGISEEARALSTTMLNRRDSSPLFVPDNSSSSKASAKPSNPLMASKDQYKPRVPAKRKKLRLYDSSSESEADEADPGVEIDLGSRYVGIAKSTFKLEPENTEGTLFPETGGDEPEVFGPEHAGTYNNLKRSMRGRRKSDGGFKAVLSNDAWPLEAEDFGHEDFMPPQFEKAHNPTFKTNTNLTAETPRRSSKLI